MVRFTENVTPWIARVALARGESAVEDTRDLARQELVELRDARYAQLYIEILALSRGDDEQLAGELIETIAALEHRDRVRAPALIGTLFETLLPHLDDGSPGAQTAKRFVLQAAGSDLVKWVSPTYPMTTEFFKKIVKSMDTDELKQFIAMEFGNETELDHEQWETAAAVFEQVPDKRVELREVFPVKARPRFLASGLAGLVDAVFGVSPLSR
jgi:hypothetical protein